MGKESTCQSQAGDGFSAGAKWPDHAEEGGEGELVRYVHGCESFMALMNTDIVNVAIHVRVHIVWYRRYVHKAEENIHMS